MLGEIIWNERTLAIGLGCCIPLTAVIGTFWYLVQKTKTENDLKRSMVERGMSADDIERVLAAGGSATPRDRQPQP